MEAIMASWGIIGHIALFIAVGGASYGMSLLGKSSNWPFILIIVAPMIGVYYLGWWSLLTFVLGWASGSYVATGQKMK